MENNILMNSIKTSKKLIGKSAMTSGNKYRITLSRNNKKVWFYFNDNIYNNSNIYDYLYCMLSDARLYENNTFKQFCADVDFDPDSLESYKIYLACKKQLQRLNKLFNQEEIKQLEKELENY